MEIHEHIRLLTEKVISGTATADDLQQLQNYLENDQAGTYAATIESLLHNNVNESPSYDPAHWENIADQLIAKAEQEQYITPVIDIPRKRGNKWVGWAAAVIILLGSGIYLFMNDKSAQPVHIAQTSAFGDDVAPGREGAMLELGDGTKILLDTVGNGELASEGNVTITKYEGQVSYQSVGKNTNDNYVNTISTPAGRQYQLVLDDGTKVWLNAHSSLQYPSKFSGKTREVKMTGEVYFEIAKNAMKPFFVSANDTRVEVLGTHFNINAYADEPFVQTTLTEGAVNVVHASNSKLLKPGQQAVINKKQPGIHIKQANINKVLAWRNGVFSFDHADIYSVMRQLSRWYDVEIEYKGNLDPAEEFGGKIPRKSNLSEVLELLQATKGARFAISGKKLTVMPYE